MKAELIFEVVTVAVSIGTLIFVACREHREGNAQAEQHTKAIIDLLRIAESATEPEAVRRFAKSELRRMKSKAISGVEHESLIARVFANKPLEAANVRVNEVDSDELVPVDEDGDRLVNVVRWWTTEATITPLRDRQLRISFVSGLFIFLFFVLIVETLRISFS